jgi:hypothetical protein
MNAGRVSPSVALAAYAEAWINGAKVVVFGDASSLLAERLIERGARHVQVYDADAARAAEASAASTSKQVSYAPLDLAGSSLRDGVFDVGIIEDLAAARQNPKALLTTLGRALSRRGLALIGSRNPDVSEPLIAGGQSDEPALGYYDFYDTVSQHFEEVRMLGQTPFVGYAIADFSAADASDVRIDTALLPGGAEEPEWFLALVSALPVAPDAFSVIQLPLADLELGASAPRADAGASEQLERAEDKIVELEAALAALAADGAREAEKYAAERARDAERFAEGRAREAEKRELAERIAALTAELEKREQWLAGLESRAATADERADEAQAEIEQRASELRKSKDQAARLEHQLEEERRAKRLLEEAARTHKQELEKLSRRAEAEAQRSSEAAAEAKKLSARIGELTAALAESEKKIAIVREEGDEEARAELARLEASLVERAREVSRLEAALHETERFGRELILKMRELETAREPAPASAELDALRQRNAELSADLEAARWTISSLEANVGGEPTASASSDAERAEATPPSQRRDEIPPAEPAPAPGID